MLLLPLCLLHFSKFLFEILSKFFFFLWEQISGTAFDCGYSDEIAALAYSLDDNFRISGGSCEVYTALSALYTSVISDSSNLYRWLENENPVRRI